MLESLQDSKLLLRGLMLSFGSFDARVWALFLASVTNFPRSPVTALRRGARVGNLNSREPRCHGT